MTENKDKLQESLEALFASYPLESDPDQLELAEELPEEVLEPPDPVYDQLQYPEPDPFSENDRMQVDAPPIGSDEIDSSQAIFQEDNKLIVEEEVLVVDDPVQVEEVWSDTPVSPKEEAAPIHEEAGLQRARQKPTESGERVVLFSLDQEIYGMDIYTIRTLVKPQETYPAPHMPDYLIGLTNLRGDIVPVIDLRTRLGIQRKEYTEKTRFVVAEHLDDPICLIVDDVNGIEQFDGASLEPPSDVIGSVDTTFVSSIAKSEHKLVLLLDLKEILGDEILGTA